MKNLIKFKKDIEDTINEIKSCLEKKYFKVVLSKEDYIQAVNEHDAHNTDVNTIIVKLFNEN